MPGLGGLHGMTYLYTHYNKVKRIARVVASNKYYDTDFATEASNLRSLNGNIRYDCSGCMSEPVNTQLNLQAQYDDYIRSTNDIFQQFFFKLTCNQVNSTLINHLKKKFIFSFTQFLCSINAR